MSWNELMILGALFGFLYGFLLQKGDFCFVSAFRDWFGFRHTRVLSGVAFLVLTALFGWSLSLLFGWGGASLDRLWLPAPGGFSLLGGVVFGVGMTVAGGCASGTLYRAGMGYLHFWIVLVFMGAGYLLFSLVYRPFITQYWFEPLTLGSPLTLYSRWPALYFLVPVFVGSIGIVWAVSRWNLTGSPSEQEPDRPSSPAGFLTRTSWDPRLVGGLLGLVMTVQFITMSIWGITGPETRITAVLSSYLLGSETVEGLSYLDGMFSNPFYGGQIVLGPWEVLIGFMILGAAVSALLSRSFRVRTPRWSRLPNAVAGGLLMGFGSRITPGCNIGNIASGLPALSVHSGLAAIGIVAGVYVSTYVLFDGDIAYTPSAVFRRAYQFLFVAAPDKTPTS